MPKTVFVQGTAVTPAFLNNLNNPRFNDNDEDGEYERLTDDALSNTPGNIKPQWQAFRDALLVTAATGLSVNIAAGAITRDDYTVGTVSATSRSLTANSTTFIWVDNTPSVQTGASLPSRCFPLAQVVTGAASITSVSDLRDRYVIKPPTRAVSVFGGGNTTDLSYGSNITLGGRIDCRNFTLSAGNTITVSSGFLWIKASGNVSIAGIINVSPIVAGGFGFSGLCNPQHYPAESGRGLGGGGGHNGAAALKYPHTAALLGSGGASGFASIAGGTPQITQSRGGFGGGAVIIEAAGTITIGGTIFCDGGAGTVASASSIGASSIVMPGGGGGSGGLIVLASLTSVTASAGSQLSIRGGSGASGYIANYSGQAQGGGGGGGGYLVVQSPSNNLGAATVFLTGGVAGATVGTGSAVAGSIGGTYSGLGGLGGFAGGSGEIINQNFTPV